MVQHELKIRPNFYNDIIEGNKTFEVRKNDRNFKVGDELILKEWYVEKGYTKREISCVVTYLLDNTEFCKEGFVVTKR